MMSARAIMNISRFILPPTILSDILSKIKLKIPAGIVAITRYQNIFPSIDFSFLKVCLYPPFIRATQSLKKKMTNARRVPICNATSMPSDSISQPNSHGNTFKCPELEIGRNSVSPCTIPNIIA